MLVAIDRQGVVKGPDNQNVCVLQSEMTPRLMWGPFIENRRALPGFRPF